MHYPPPAPPMFHPIELLSSDSKITVPLAAVRLRWLPETKEVESASQGQPSPPLAPVTRHWIYQFEDEDWCSKVANSVPQERKSKYSTTETRTHRHTRTVHTLTAGGRWTFARSSDSSLGFSSPLCLFPRDQGRRMDMFKYGRTLLGIAHRYGGTW